MGAGACPGEVRRISPVANARVIPDALDPEETLEIERRWLPKAAVLAIAAGLMPVLALVLQVLTTRGLPSDIGTVKTVAQSLTIYGAGEQGAGLIGEQAELASHLGDNAVLMAAGGAVSAIGGLLIAPVLAGLLRSAWRRRPSFSRRFIWLPIVGGVVFGLATLASSIYGAMELADFAKLAPAQQTNDAALDALTARQDDLRPVLYAAMLGQMLIAVGIGSAALSAMNVGLLTRLMGFLGIMVAAASLLPLDQQGMLRALWLLALGVVLLGKLPGGRPAAWEAGTPQPWPTRAEMMEAAERAREAQQSEIADPAPKPKAGSGGRKRRK